MYKTTGYMACLDNANYTMEVDMDDLMIMCDNLINLLKTYNIDDDEILEAINDELDLDIKKVD
jgi:hypothetical protein